MIIELHGQMYDDINELDVDEPKVKTEETHRKSVTYCSLT